MNYRLSKFPSGITYWLMALLFMTCGCQGIFSKHVDTPSPVQSPGPGGHISFAELPQPVQEFHNRLNLTSETQTPIFAVTWFPRPYSKFFHVLRLFEDGSVLGFAEIPDWAVQGGLPLSKLNADELQGVGDILNHLAEVQTPTIGKGTTIVTLSFEAQAKRHIITCTEAECPKEIRDLFEIAERAFQRNTDAHVLVPSPFKSEDE
jgi:hypothetical protein